MRHNNHKKEIGVGLIGFGTVGTGVVKWFKGNGERFNLQLRRVAVADLSKPRSVQFSSLTDKPADIFSDPKIDIVVELMGGLEPARTILLDAINEVNHVVTGNKKVLAFHGKELFDAARSRSVSLGFEASVGGGIPIINVFKRLRGEEICGFGGILNGTDNYILTKMERSDFASALRGAQQKGYAEADPTEDIEGYDTRYKLAVAASVAFNAKIDVNQIPCTGITGVSKIDIDFADKYGQDEGGKGHAVKLLAVAKRRGSNRLELHVNPVMISRNNPLASVSNSYNAILTEGELAGPQMYYGKGAGEKPTTSAVVSDIVHIAENIRKGISDELPSLDNQVTFTDPSKVKQRGYIRVNLLHQPGSGSEVLRILSAHRLNVEDSLQRKRFRFKEKGIAYIPDIITFEAARQGQIDAALEEITRSDRVFGRPFFMAIMK